MNKTYYAKCGEVKNNWLLVDAKDKVLGRLASQIASTLRGKHKAEFTPHMDVGDYVVVINADKIIVTGSKADNKKYYRHTGYPGGIRETTFKKMQKDFPGRAVEKAVKGMLPKGPLGSAMFKKLKVYSGENHPHHAQAPAPLVF